MSVVFIRPPTEPDNTAAPLLSPFTNNFKNVSFSEVLSKFARMVPSGSCVEPSYRDASGDLSELFDTELVPAAAVTLPALPPGAPPLVPAVGGDAAKLTGDADAGATDLVDDDPLTLLASAPPLPPVGLVCAGTVGLLIESGDITLGELVDMEGDTADVTTLPPTPGGLVLWSSPTPAISK